MVWLLFRKNVTRFLEHGLLFSTRKGCRMARNISLPQSGLLDSFWFWWSRIGRNIQWNWSFLWVVYWFRIHSPKSDLFAFRRTEVATYAGKRQINSSGDRAIPAIGELKSDDLACERVVVWEEDIVASSKGKCENCSKRQNLLVPNNLCSPSESVVIT